MNNDTKEVRAMAPHDKFQRAAWRKSSYSNGATQCTEVARVGTRTAIRDSKNPGGPVLLLTAGQMRTLIHRIKTGQVIALPAPGTPAGRSGMRCSGCTALITRDLVQEAGRVNAVLPQQGPPVHHALADARHDLRIAAAIGLIERTAA